MKKIVIVGGGTAGISVASALLRKRSDLEIKIIEPSETHYYQPLWTLVGGGVFPLEKSARPMRHVIPDGTEWVKGKVESFLPELNEVVLENGNKLSYDYLVVAPGIQLDWSRIEGLKETLGKNGVCSNYSKDYVEYTWECMNNLKDGNAIFTFPSTPIKCAGAPQKVMYLAEETFRNNHVRDDVEVKFISAGGAIFGVQKYRDALEKVVDEKNIITQFQYDLFRVDGENQVAYFKHIETGEVLEQKFTMLHVSPHMSSPDFIKKSPLANEAGWVDVDKFSTQHNKYSNIFSIGDASSLPNSKTGAAIRKQGPVLVKNLLAEMYKKKLKGKYSGYASCPLVTSRSTCILAEFDYSGQPAETFPFNQAKERKSMYILKAFLIPFMYWNAMLKGFF